MTRNGNGKQTHGDPVFDALAGLPDEIRPERDLWPGIESRLGEQEPVAMDAPEPQAFVRPAWAWQAAAAVALVAVSSLVTFVMTRTPEPPPLAELDRDNGHLVVPASRFGSDYLLGQNYEAARTRLERDLDRHLQALPEETRKVIVSNLAEIREAVEEINAALDEDPNNVLLQELLMKTYQDELSFLMNVNRMAGSLPPRTEI